MSHAPFVPPGFSLGTSITAVGRAQCKAAGAKPCRQRRCIQWRAGAKARLLAWAPTPPMLLNCSSHHWPQLQQDQRRWLHHGRQGQGWGQGSLHLQAPELTSWQAPQHVLGLANVHELILPAHLGEAAAEGRGRNTRGQDIKAGTTFDMPSLHQPAKVHQGHDPIAPAAGDMIPLPPQPATHACSRAQAMPRSQAWSGNASPTAHDSLQFKPNRRQQPSQGQCSTHAAAELPENGCSPIFLP